MSLSNVEWRVSESLVPYEEALAVMQERVEGIIAKTASPLIWLLEHPPLYTAGTSSNQADVLNAEFPVYESGRGGQLTYHGPGQRVAYLMLDLKQLFAPAEPDLRAFIQRLERWIIATLAELGVASTVRNGRIGVWVEQPSEAKIAAIGVRVRRWVSSHGIAINVNPQMDHFQGIVPCGIREFGVTSLRQLGVDASMEALDKALKKHLACVCD